ncbi:MAG TPA: GatB/YqeY domain-containing protein [Aestuariivirgaceae bacterium]|nr:GatB/YqeY domain-containing protein [Aestuariivirgaceae bacterium]
MALRDEINGSLKEAMKSGDKLKVSALRLMNAAIKERDIQNRTAGPDAGVSDQQILEVFAKMVKQRQESLATYEQAGREDLARQERGEIEIIQSFMPKQLSEEEMKAEAAKAVRETGAQGMKDMGKVMAALKERFAGRMDFGKAGAIVKSLLG